MGRTTKVTSKKKNGVDISNVSYSYDAIDNMTEIVRGDGMKYVLEYDAYQNLDSIGIDGKSEKLIKYTYRDNNGRLKKITYANGDYMRLAYDRFGNMISEKWYDKDNNLTYEYLYAYDGEGNIFVCWEGSDGSYYNAGESYRKNYNVTLTPVWTTSSQFVVTYDINGGIGNLPIQRASSNTRIYIHSESPSKDGYMFYCWKDESGKEYFVGDTIYFNKNHKLIADYRKIYTITYLNDNGSVFAQQTKLHNIPIEAIENTPQKDGYVFLKWQNPTVGNVRFGYKIYANDDIVFTPKWYKSYDLIFWADSSFKFKTVVDGASVSMPTPASLDLPDSKTGYTFFCWKRANRNEYYFPGDYFRPSADVGFDAVWVSNGKAGIAYDTGDSSTAIKSQEVSIGSTITVPSIIPEKSGCTFAGWKLRDASEAEAQTYSLARSGYNGYLFGGDTFTANCSKILEAEYDENIFRITNVPENNILTLDDISYQLQWLFYPQVIDVTVNYSSSDTNVASINSNGLILVKTPGETTITAIATKPVTNVGYKYSFDLLIADRELSNTFSDPYNLMPEDGIVRYKALNKMELYYRNNDEVRNWIGEGGTCIFAFEGLGEGFGGVTKNNQTKEPYCYHKLPYNFLNAMMVVTKGKEIVYITRRASTLPDWRPESISLDRTTTLKEGIYDYKTGNHSSTYIALRPNWEKSPKSFWDSWYFEDDEFKPGGADGINLHATSKTPLSPSSGAHSQGCQTVYWEDYIDFGKKVGFLKDSEYPNITYEKVGDYFSRKIGLYYTKAELENNPNLSTNAIYIMVKYILDRSYDEKNDNPDYPEGVFYPA